MEKVKLGKENRFSLFSKKLAISILVVLFATIISFGFFNINRLHYYAHIVSVVTVLLLMIFVFFASDLRYYIFNYLKESYIECQKVVWSDKNEVIKITIVVFLFVVVMAVFLWLVDAFASWFVYNVILSWR